MSSPFIQIKVQREDFDVNAEISQLTHGHTDIGALVSFIGLCRDEGGSLAALELEHYPGMAEAQIEAISADAYKRWDLQGLIAIHRYGNIIPGDNIVLVITAARHRQAAFEGANYLMDFLKTSAPFWKKEILNTGEEGKWVSAKDEDEDALEKWGED